MRRYRVWLPMGALLLAVLSAPNAHAAEVSVAVLGIEPIGVPESLAQGLTDALRQRLGATSGVRLVPGKDLVEVKMVFSCDGESPACMAQAGRTFGADKLLYAILKKAPSKTAVNISLKLLDVKTATVEKSVNEVLPKREVAGAAASATAARWLTALLEIEAKPTLTVTSDPPGANLTVDGKDMGRTPVTLRDLPVGTHTVVLSAPGRASATRSVELRAGGSHDVVVTLEPEPNAQAAAAASPAPQAPEEEAPPLTRAPPRARVPAVGHPGRTAKILGITGMSLGVAAAAVAIYTWRMYTDTLANQTHDDLVALHPTQPSPSEQQFFTSPTCNVPTSLQASNPNAANKYRNDCNAGTAYANATTGLWISAGVIAAAGVVSFVLGDRQATKAKERSTVGVMRQTLRIAPMISTQGGGLEARFEF